MKRVFNSTDKMKEIAEDLALLKIYLNEYIDKHKPVLLDYQIEQYGKTGFIEKGHNSKNFVPFSIWMNIRTGMYV